MKHITAKIFACLLFSGVLFSSCIGNFDNINGNPYQPTTSQMDADNYLLQSAFAGLASGVVPVTNMNLAQFTESLLGGPAGGYFASANGGWNTTVDNYNATDNWTWPFMKDITPIIYPNLNVIINLSEKTGNPVPAAIATIMKVAGMHRVADTYGPIPYSKVGVSFIPAYDPMEDVYAAFFDELNYAIETLNENRTRSLSATVDIVFGGDNIKWIRYANSLKLRLAMRIAYADPAKSKQMAEEAVAHELGVITSNDGNASNKALGAEGNPIAFTSRGWGDSAAAADIVCYMNGYGDARRAKYFTTSTWPGRTYVGLRRGIGTIPDKSTVSARYSFPGIENDELLQWMNAAEVAFLRAEGAAVFGYDMGGTAEQFYNDGIRLSFQQWGVSGAEEYLANDTAVPETYVDPYDGNPQNYPGQLSTITIKWNESAPTEQKQERIITQKWIANWTLGNEAWADYRRTNYPRLIPATAAGNKSGGIVDSNRGARRMPYPQDENISNKSNYQTAVSQYLKGPDNMATRIWWDCK